MEVNMRNYDLPNMSAKSVEEINKFLYKTIERMNENILLMEKEINDLKKGENDGKK